MYGNPPDAPLHSSDTEKQRAFRGIGPQPGMDGQASLTSVARSPKARRGGGGRPRSSGSRRRGNARRMSRVE